MMSVNQIMAQIKIQEVWKALNFQDYPVGIEKQFVKEVGPATRASTNGRLIEKGESCSAQKTCINDYIKLWNKLPSLVTECNTFYQIKVQSKLFAKTLPI